MIPLLCLQHWLKHWAIIPLLCLQHWLKHWAIITLLCLVITICIFTEYSYLTVERGLDCFDRHVKLLEVNVCKRAYATGGHQERLSLPSSSHRSGLVEPCNSQLNQLISLHVQSKPLSDFYAEQLQQLFESQSVKNETDNVWGKISFITVTQNVKETEN